MGHLRQLFLRFDNFAQGTIPWKVGTHVSMCGWLFSFPAYFLGIKTAGKKAQEKVEKLEAMYNPVIKDLTARVVEMEKRMDTETVKREKLAQKANAGLKQLNRRVSVVETGLVSKEKNDNKKPYSVKVTRALLVQLSRQSEQK